MYVSSDDHIYKWMLERLKYKCMILVTSLIEMKETDDILLRIMRSLPIDLLKNQMRKNFKKYSSVYQDQYLKESLEHFQGNPLTDKSKGVEYYENIIETGF